MVEDIIPSINGVPHAQEATAARGSLRAESWGWCLEAGWERAEMRDARGTRMGSDRICF